MTTHRTLRVYTEGSDVRRVQQALMSAGHLSPKTAKGRPSDDGIYGPQTADAVRAYQRRQGLSVDGVVGPETWASIEDLLAAPDPCDPTAPPQPEHPRLLPDVEAVWVHRLDKAVESSGSPAKWAVDVRQAGQGLVHIKLADGRSTWHDGGHGVLLDESVRALRGEGVDVSGWQWVYGVYGEPGGHQWAVEYLREQAEALADACAPTGLRIAVANCEGDGYWSMSPWGAKGQKIRATWPNDYRQRLDERMTAYARRLRGLMGDDAVLGQSTHGLPSSQMLPWVVMTDAELWDVVMCQLYYRNGKTWRGLVDRAVEEWAAYGVTGTRLRVTGGIWEPAHVPGVAELRAAVEAQARMGGCAKQVDWWAWDKAKAAHLAALASA